MHWPQLLIEAVLYYFSCSLLSKDREHAPGLIRILITVLLCVAVTGGIRLLPLGGWEIWSQSVLGMMVQFMILWVGLGIGFFRTILATLLVGLLHTLLEYVFLAAGANSPNSLI